MSPIAPTTNLAHVDDVSQGTNATPLALDVLVAPALKWVEDQLRELRGLPAGWDGGRARAIPNETIDFAEAVFGALVTPGDDLPAVVPTVKGGIQYEWHTATFDVEIAIPRPSRIEVYLVNRVTGDDEMDIAAAPNEVSIILNHHGVRLS